MLRTRSCVADGSSPALAMVSATAVTSVIARNCTLPRAVSSKVPEPKPAGDAGQRRQLCGGDHPAGQSDPDQRAVSRLMHLQRTWTSVGIAGSGHVSTVRQK